MAKGGEARKERAESNRMTEQGSGEKGGERGGGCSVVQEDSEGRGVCSPLFRLWLRIQNMQYIRLVPWL